MQATHKPVSSKEIQKARRIAKRTRSAIACVRCKVSKVKCNDYRPCKHCTESVNLCQDATVNSFSGSEDMGNAQHDQQISTSTSFNMRSRREDVSDELQFDKRKPNIGALAVQPTTYPNRHSSALSAYAYPQRQAVLQHLVLLQPSWTSNPFSTSLPQNNFPGQFSPAHTILNGWPNPQVAPNQPSFPRLLSPAPSSATAQSMAILDGGRSSAPLPAFRPDILANLLFMSSAVSMPQPTAAFLPRL